MKFSAILERWYRLSKRDLPWRNAASPYHVWLSEIILQQTRVSQGTEYYLKFVDRYPRIEDLANAPEDEVLKLWQGLGYYTRARNLHATAKIITREYGGSFPDTYEALLKLKGIGPYTAAAIASIAFKRPVALVDGNVYRVIARLYDIHLPVHSSEGKKEFIRLANQLLNRAKPDIHNQSLMEFGALVCLPRNPHCNACDLASNCLALERGTVSSLPVKKEKAISRTRYFNYLFIQYNGMTFLKKRNRNDIWHSLFEFPMVETPAKAEFNNLIHCPPWDIIFRHQRVKKHNGTRVYQHKLTHQTLICSFYLVSTAVKPDLIHPDYIAIELDRIDEFPVPRAIERFLEDLVRDKDTLRLDS